MLSIYADCQRGAAELTITQTTRVVIVLVYVPPADTSTQRTFFPCLNVIKPFIKNLYTADIYTQWIHSSVSRFPVQNLDKKTTTI